MSPLLEEQCWPDVQAYLRQDDRLILVVGSTEQHGRHLVLGSDVWQPWEIAQRVSERTGVLLAPSINYGMSLHHLGFPGSLSLRPQTLTSILIDLLESAYEHGFRRILILNGHGGNIAALQVALAELLNELPGLKVNLRSWWQEAKVKEVLDAAFPDRPGGHADAGETSVVMAIRPDVVRLDRAAHSPDAPRPGFLARQVFLEDYPHGVIGIDPRLASVEVGQRVLEVAEQLYAQVLEDWA